MKSLIRRENHPVWLDWFFALPITLRFLVGLIVLSLAGTMLFFLPGVSTRPLRFEDALFTSVSALTVTGLATINLTADLTMFGKILLLFLTQIGGIGFMIFTVVVYRLMGRSIPLVDRIAMRNFLGVLEPGAVVQLAWRVLAGVFVIEGLGASVLAFHWQRILPGQLDSGWTITGYAIFHAVSAFCNAGFDLFAGQQNFPSGIPTDPITLLILALLIVSGGLGVPIIADLLTFPVDHKLTLHTRITLVFVAGLIVLGGLGIFTTEAVSRDISTVAGWIDLLGRSFFQSVAARSAGFNVFADFERLAPASQFLIMLLMFIGAAPASMGGGITTGTAVVLGLAMGSYIRNRPYPEISRRSISVETIRRATAVLIISLLVVTIAAWLLLVSHPGTTLSQALFEVISAFATCGLTLAFTARLNFFGQLVLILVMFWGRLGAISVVVALARPQAAQRIQYPEEQILIG